MQTAAQRFGLTFIPLLRERYFRVVLATDPFTLDPMRVHEAVPVLTVVDGRITYRSEDDHDR